ncbi:S26 family signal peptidase [Streptomyces sp. NPDC044989]|uniref:S26 family signal peptidase n=1 Tax=Streptomyces sp. NPDC044989 TaxID=3154336 RepID=UPI0033FD60A7
MCPLIVVTVRGISMQPTLTDGDRVLVRRRVLPKRGGMAVVEQPMRRAPHWSDEPAGLGCWKNDVGARNWMIKRVVAAPGDQVPLGRTGNSHVDGSRVPEEHLLLLGDNAEVSFDSRHVGFFPADRILGSVWHTLSRGTKKA